MKHTEAKIPVLLQIVLISFFCGCATLTTTKVEQSNELRNSAATEKVETVFQERRKANTSNPRLEIAVTYRIAKGKSYQRRYIENRSLKAEARIGLWLGGVIMASTGYMLMRNGYVVLGRDLIGLGLLAPLGGVAIAKKEVGEQWKDEKSALPMKTEPAAATPLRITVSDSSWDAVTDIQGEIEVDISSFADSVTLGNPLTVTFALAEDSEQKASFVVPASVVNHHRTLPEIQFASPFSRGDEGESPVPIAVVLSSVSGLITAVDYSVTGGTSEGEGMDYLLKAGRLTIPAGDTSAIIDILITDDDAVEGNESIQVSLYRPMNATLGGNTMHSHIIIDNDEARPVPAVSTGNIAIIAILDFQGIGVSDQDAMVLTNRLGTQMVQLGRYQVIERGQMEQILQEQDFQLTGCTSDECAVEIGQLLGAQQMLAGSFGKLGTVYTIDMRIIDVETGRILKSTSYDIEGSINRLLSEGLTEAVRRIAEIE